MKKTNVLITIAFALAVTGALLVGGVTAAQFTSVARVDQNAFQSGELEVRLDREDGNHYFDIANIAPGESGSNDIVVTNTGSMDFEYQLLITLSGNLAGGDHPLVVTVYGRDGESVDLQTARHLAPGEAETLTVVWQLPSAAGNEYQGATAQLDLLVQAEQISG